MAGPQLDNGRRKGSLVATATVLLSGGIDSATCVAYHLDQGFKVGALFVNYGQRSANRELRAARRVARHFRVPLRVVELVGAHRKRWGLIPGRNAFLIGIAALECKVAPAVLGIGVHSGTKYRDCSPAFIQAMQRCLDVSAVGGVQLSAPFLRWRKVDILALAREMSVPLALTYSCERGVDQPCGRCDSCNDLEVLGVGAQ